MAKTEPKIISVDYPVFDQTIPVWANQLTVQFIGDYVIAFYAALPPLVVGATEEEGRARADKLLTEITGVPVKCVAKVVVPKDRMQEFVRVMTENLRRSESGESEEKGQAPAKEETDA